MRFLKKVQALSEVDLHKARHALAQEFSSFALVVGDMEIPNIDSVKYESDKDKPQYAKDYKQAEETLQKLNKGLLSLHDILKNYQKTMRSFFSATL